MQTLSDFLNHPLATRMLKYDVTFHGGIVAEVLSGRDLSDYWKKSDEVTASVPIGSAVFVGRELHDWIVHATHDEKLTHRMSTFVLKDDEAFGAGTRVTLQLYCWKRNPGNGMVPRLDVDLLYITRSGVSVATGEVTNNMPCPIAHFMAQCQRAEYKILEQPVADDSKLVERMQSLLDVGWLPVNSEVHYMAVEDSDEKCPICHEPLGTGSHPVETPCGHQYHETCWLQHINHSVARAATEIPAASPLAGVFQFAPPPRQHRVHVACPMCRHSIRSIFCTPG